MLDGRIRNGDRKDGRDKDKTQTRIRLVNEMDGFYWEVGMEVTKEMR